MNYGGLFNFPFGQEPDETKSAPLLGRTLEKILPELSARVIGKDGSIYYQGPWRGLDPVDVGRVFTPYHKDTISHRFKKYLNDLRIAGHFHMLRHTSATQMLNNGIPLPVIQAILGHSNISTTQIYAKVHDELRKKEMKKLKF